MRIVFDTNVLISALGNRENQGPVRNANLAISICHDSGYGLFISERSLVELEKGWENYSVDKIAIEKKFLQQFELLGYHLGDEAFSCTDGNWATIETKWGDSHEIETAHELKRLLSGMTKNDRRDRGILLDVLMARCDVLLTEDTSDFRRFTGIASSAGIIIQAPSEFVSE